MLIYALVLFRYKCVCKSAKHFHLHRRDWRDEKYGRKCACATATGVLIFSSGKYVLCNTFYAYAFSLCSRPV